MMQKLFEGLRITGRFICVFALFPRVSPVKDENNNNNNSEIRKAFGGRQCNTLYAFVIL